MSEAKIEGVLNQITEKEDLKQLNPYDQCDEVFLLWISPFIVGVALIVLAVVLRSLGKLEKADSRAAMVILAVAAGLWVTASLAGAGMGKSVPPEQQPIILILLFPGTE